MTDQISPADDSEKPDAPTAPPRSRAPRALAITAIAVAGALTLGLAFAGGVGLGRLLPDHRPPVSVEVRWPFGGPSAERFDDRQQRSDDRQQRDDRVGDRADRRELFERWLEQQGDLPADSGE